MIKAICLILGTFGSAKECSKHLELDKLQTSVSEIELKNVLKDTHYSIFHNFPSENRINMAWAQIAIENGRGKYVYNYNLGNIGTYANKYSKPFYKVAGSRFRAFFSIKEGAKAYWSYLKEKCKIALFQFDTGNVKESASSLKRCNYYKSDLDTYYVSMQSLFVHANKLK